jgi:hypothetical protein
MIPSQSEDLQGVLSNCYCHNCLSEIRQEGRPRSHFHKPIASVCNVTPHCKQALFLQECFLTSCFILSALDDKIEQCVCVKFYVKLGNSASEAP